MNEQAPRVGFAMWKRFALAAFVVIFGASATTATAVLLEVKGVADALERYSGVRIDTGNELTADEAGKPQTILVIGSDKRYKADKADARSDTLILVRMDPHKHATAVLSIPRDLKVEIPGYGTDKINAAYSLGGPKKTLETVKDLLGIKIHHIVNVNFGGFRRAVNYVGCIYTDIDRRYFNDNSGGENYATIDIQPGYQKLCGRDALDYVRYRHTDSDLVRAARQQDFLRHAKDQVGVQRILDDRDEFVKLFARYTQTDIRGTKSLLRLGLLVAFSSGQPLREVHFRTQDAGDGYLESSQRDLDRVVREFLEFKASQGPRGTLEPTAEEKQAARKQKRKKRRKVRASGLEDTRREGENQAIASSRKVDFPMYYPTLRMPGSRFVDIKPRTYTIRDTEGCPEKPDWRKPCGGKHRAYRMVLKMPVIGEFYGVQGTTWMDPPILRDPSEKRRVGGRELLIYRDGRRVRLVAWKTKRAVYWVSNTLLQTIPSRKMVQIAASLDRLG